jgi:hypothetical protein
MSKFKRFTIDEKISIELMPKIQITTPLGQLKN